MNSFLVSLPIIQNSANSFYDLWGMDTAVQNAIVPYADVCYRNW